MKKTLLSLFVVGVSAINAIAGHYTITASNYQFSPDSISIYLGDTVTFGIVSGQHTATEVTQANWNANSPSPLSGGFNITTSTSVSDLTVGTHYYVCLPHVSSQSCCGRLHG